MTGHAGRAIRETRLREAGLGCIELPCDEATMNPTPDWISETYDDLLGDDGLASDATALRGSVLAATLPVVRRRRWIRRATTAALLAACYVAGVLSPLGRSPVDSTPIASRDAAEDKAAPQQTTPAKEAKPGEPRQPAAPNRLAADRRTKYETFRDGGDRFLQEIDVSSAVRGYAAALRSATAEERALAPGRDSWLLLALKRAKLQERTHDEPTNH
jgi:hypothetical protein